MDNIVVPQFLDVESKIIGSITVRQFIELLIAGLMIFIFYKIFDFTLFVFLSIIIAFAVLILAFIKMNGQPFHYFLLNLIITLKNPKLQVWKKEVSNSDLKKIHNLKAEDLKPAPVAYRQPVSSSKLSELSLIVDTGGVYRGEEYNEIIAKQF